MSRATPTGRSRRQRNLPSRRVELRPSRGELTATFLPEAGDPAGAGGSHVRRRIRRPGWSGGVRHLGGGRRVSLRFVEGYRFAQVYAPPKSRFICFEPMTAPVNPFESERTRLAEPGSARRARFEVVVRTSGLE